MSLRTLFIFTAVAIAFLFVSTVKAASPAQAVGEPGNVEQVVVDSTGAFTLTLKIDEVTTVAIPLRVNWRAQGPLQDNPNQVTVVISPTVLETGIFPVTLGAIEAATGTLAITLTQPSSEIAPITPIEPITSTEPTTTTTTPEATATLTPTVAGTVPETNAPTTNVVANLRGGPGTNYPVINTAPAGERLNIAGRNEDGTWLLLANGAWLAAALVNNVPQGLPVVQPSATPIPAPTTASPPGETPIPAAPAPELATPTPAPSLVITPTAAPAP